MVGDPENFKCPCGAQQHEQPVFAPPVLLDEETKELMRRFIEAVDILKGGGDINIPSQWSADTEELPQGILTTARTNCKRLYWSNGKIYQEE